MRPAMTQQLFADLVPLAVAAVIIFGALRLIQWRTERRHADERVAPDPPDVHLGGDKQH